MIDNIKIFAVPWRYIPPTSKTRDAEQEHGLVGCITEQDALEIKALICPACKVGTLEITDKDYIHCPVCNHYYE